MNPNTQTRKFAAVKPGAVLTTGLCVFVLIFLVGVSASASALNVRLAKQQDKEFVSIRHYQFREQFYEPPAAIKAFEREPARYNGPEMVVRGLVSAMKAGNYEWWLRLWDRQSQELLLARADGHLKLKKLLEPEWRARSYNKIEMVRWIETGTYVIVTYRRRGNSNDEVPVVVELAENGWRATLDLDNDPVLHYLRSGETTLERQVRPERDG